MREMFDINLLAQVSALDRKSSVSQEQFRLKRKNADDSKHKGAHHSPGRNSDTTEQSAGHDMPDGRSGGHPNIDITV